MTTIKTKILETVEKNNIRMIPKWKFALYSFVGIVGLFFIFFFTVFTFSLVLFVLSQYGITHMPFFGFIAALHALNTIPLLLSLTAILLLVLIEVISQKYTFIFRRPLAITLLLTTSLAIFISFLISQTPMHEYVRDYTRTHRMGMMSKAYDRPLPFKNIQGMTAIRGVVVETSTSTTLLKLFDGVLFRAFASTTGAFVPPEIGTDIVILGNFLEERFEIYEIREASQLPFNKKRKIEGDPQRKRMMNKEIPFEVIEMK